MIFHYRKQTIADEHKLGGSFQDLQKVYLDISLIHYKT